MQHISRSRGSANVMASSNMSKSTFTRAKSPAAKSEMAIRWMPTDRMGLAARSGGPCLCRKLPSQSDPMAYMRLTIGSCEHCKLRKVRLPRELQHLCLCVYPLRTCSTIDIVQVRCDRGQPDCGWCTRNGQLCEYKERKKPGLRAGYGRELERRLGINYGTCLPSPIWLLNKT
jgi:hypothetical protein